MEKPKASTEKTPNVASTAATKPSGPEIPQKLPPLFRKVDWLTLGITFLAVFIGYLLTIAPEMTLEDSGELAVGSFYAGIPHPPGYPVWTLYTYLWTLLPFGNVAWRVGLGCAFSGALASSLLALVVSRGSSMIIESIDDFKNLNRRLEGTICTVSGFVAGLLLGFNGYMWSQSVIVEVYPLSVVSLLGVVVCLMRWTYAPHQHRYLYWAFFCYGICVNNHQSLLVIAMGVEVLIWLAEPKLGRELFAWNTLIYLAGLIAGPSLLTTNTSVFVIFNLIGVGSVILWFWLAFRTKRSGTPSTANTLPFIAATVLYLVEIKVKSPAIVDSDIVTFLFHVIGIGSIGWLVWLSFDTQRKISNFVMDVSLLALGGCPLLLIAGITHYIPQLAENEKILIALGILSVLAVVPIAFFIKRTWGSYREWFITLLSGFSWLAGCAFYLFMPISGATNPPMQWGYPRTLEGFIHAVTRGQYDRIHPTTGSGEGFEVLTSFVSTYSMQLWRFLEGLNTEFGLIFLLVALVVFLFFFKMKRRERVWILGMIALFICLGPFLVLLLNFSSDRQSLELNRVFLTSSHVFVGMSVGYGLTLLAASMAVHFDQFRKLSILGGICVLDLSIFVLALNSQLDFDPDSGTIYGLAKLGCWLAAFICITILWRKGLEHDRLVAYGIPGIFVLTSIGFSIATFLGGPGHWGSQNISEIFNAIGNAFSPNHYGLPVLAALLLVMVSVVFLAATLLSRAKAPIAVMLAIFALIPGYSIMTHWFDNEQREHWFGYWFGHDMFTPPYKNKEGKLVYDAEGRREAMKGPKAKFVYPEMDRDTILFGGTDPGRFAPTYMIFADSFIPDSCKPAVDQKFDRRDVYIITQNALADGTYLQYIRAHYFKSDEVKYDSPFFQELLRGTEERSKDGRFSYETNALARLAYNVLDKPVTEFGAKVEARRRKEGVYPPKEIYIPTPEDSQRCFSEYIEDAQRRLMHDQQFPNEQRQIRPGETVNIENGRVQVSGQVAVMAINGLLTKVIFDHNPTNEFYVEESFPLDWMYPHLTPFGIIMKINRKPLPELSDEIVQRDHEFWSDYSERLIGNWITYDTPVKDIAAFAERVYLKHDFTGYKGDRKFVRDDNAQKAFSKLRSSIGGIYAWRLGFSSGAPTPAQYLPKTEAERARMMKEADFAFKQAFAFCPFSPEAVFRYVQLLANMGRMEDAVLVAETCQKLDPFNGQVTGLVQQLKGQRPHAEISKQMQAEIAKLEKQVAANPTDLQKTFDLAGKYFQVQQPEKGNAILDGIVNNPKADPNAVFTVANAYAQMNNMPKLEATLQRLTKIAPNEPEAWYNLAAARAMLGKADSAVQDLKQAITLSTKRLQQNKNATDLRAAAERDDRFAGLRDLPEFKALIAK